MTSWQGGGMQESWRDRAVEASEALALVRSGDSVFLGTAIGTPRTLVQALAILDRPLRDVRLVSFLTDGGVPLVDGRPSGRFRHTVFFVGTDHAALVDDGAVDYVPVSVAQVAGLLETGRLSVDVALVTVSPPDDEGWCSLGVSVDVTRAAVRSARSVVAEVNARMPRTHGASRVHLDELDALVAVDQPLVEWVHDPAEDVARAVAGYIARLVGDGSTLQVGLGRIPNEMLRYLDTRRDLGIHSDVITDAVADLVDAGVVTGARKTVHRDRVVTSWCMGSQRLYDLVDDDPRFCFLPLKEVCDLGVIAAQERMISVTQAFAVDLTGQVCADSFDGRLYGGVSTQAEFHRGAAAAPGGKAIVCLSSTAPDGTSRIRVRLHEAEAVTIPRAEVHWVVTEYGTAYLFGAPLRERALALLAIAHPDHRARLLTDAVATGLLPAGQQLRSRRAYPEDAQRELDLADGREVRVRPTRATDVGLLQQLFRALPPGDVYTRFFTNLQALPAPMAEHLTNVSYDEEMAFVAVVGDPEDERAVATAQYYVDPSTNLADVAYMVHPDWQGHGLATALQEVTIGYARRAGVRGFTASVLPQNRAMLAVLERSGTRMRTRVESGVYEIVMEFD